MIRGVVTPTLDATIPLSLIDASGGVRDVVAVIDTAFDGFLTLPPDLLARLAAVPVGPVDATLGDGSEARFAMYRVTVVWNGRRRGVFAPAIDGTPLVGTGLLRRHELRVRYIDGGAVTVSALR